MKISCPACGSEALSKETREAHIPIEFGRDVSIEESIYICQDCGTDGDFADENDKRIEEALEVAKKQSTSSILDNLSNRGVTMAYIERAFGLPARTLARWKQGNVSASGFALLKTVETYPWILKVADERFDKSYAIRRMIEEAAVALQTVMDPHVVCKEHTVTSDGDTATINMSLTLQKSINTRPVIINNSTAGHIVCK